MAVIIISITKINITFNTNTIQADTITSMTTDDADKYLEDAIKDTNSPSCSTRQAQIANAIYSKKIYELLKEKENK